MPNWIEQKLASNQELARLSEKPVPLRLPHDEPLFAVPRDMMKTFDRDLRAAGIPTPPTGTLEEGEKLAVEYTCRPVQEDGTERIAEGCNVFVIRAGKIQKLPCYFNPADF